MLKFWEYILVFNPITVVATMIDTAVWLLRLIPLPLISLLLIAVVICILRILAL